MQLPKSVLDRIQQKEVEAALSTYSEESSQKGHEKVLLYILELSRGDAAEAAEYVECAKRDYRDIIMWVENPAESHRDTPEKVEGFNKMLEQFGAKWRVPKE